MASECGCVNSNQIEPTRARHGNLTPALTAPVNESEVQLATKVSWSPQLINNNNNNNNNTTTTTTTTTIPLGQRSPAK